MCDRSSSLHRGLFPLVARPGRRTLVPCLHIEHRCQANPLARAPLERTSRPLVALRVVARSTGRMTAKKTRISPGHRPQSAEQGVRGRRAWYDLPPLSCSPSTLQTPPPRLSNSLLVTGTSLSRHQRHKRHLFVGLCFFRNISRKNLMNSIEERRN